MSSEKALLEKSTNDLKHLLLSRGIPFQRSLKKKQYYVDKYLEHLKQEDKYSNSLSNATSQ